MKPNPIAAPRRIKDLPGNVSLENLRFRYPGDGQSYYWASQWGKGVWGRKNLGDSRIHPLFCADLEEALEWEVVES